MARLKSDEICKLLDTLVGYTFPVSDSSIDNAIAENLDILIDISYWVIRRLYRTSEYRTSSYCSSKEIGEKAYLAMMDLKEYFDDLEVE